MGNKRIPTLIGILVLALGVAAGVFLVSSRQFLGVEAEIAKPQDVRVTNVSDRGFTVSWTTSKESVGFVKYGSSEGSLSGVSGSNNQTASRIHHLVVPDQGGGLNANTEYFLKIVSEGVEFDNNGVAWRTGNIGAELDLPQGEPNVISGSITDSSGGPIRGALVRASISGVDALSTISSSSGDWAITLSTARTTDRQAYANITDSSLIDIFVRSEDGRIASAKMTPTVAKPAPAIVLGQSHDFRSSEIISSDVGTPTASLPPLEQGDNQVNETPQPSASASPAAEALPSGKASGFVVVDTEVEPSIATVEVESIVDGEVINTNKPEFFGVAPAGLQLSIKVESTDPITDQVQAASDGDWSWSPPENLDPGEHKLTVSWRDASGILRSITRTFVVQASEDPAFVATSSAGATSTPTSTPKQTSTPVATIKPTATALTTAIPTPRITIPSTESAIPQSGSLTPTVLISMMGIMLLIFGYFAIRGESRKN